LKSRLLLLLLLLLLSLLLPPLHLQRGLQGVAGVCIALPS